MGITLDVEVAKTKGYKIHKSIFGNYWISERGGIRGYFSSSRLPRWSRHLELATELWCELPFSLQKKMCEYIFVDFYNYHACENICLLYIQYKRGELG